MQYTILFAEPETDFARRDDAAHMGAWRDYIDALGSEGLIVAGEGHMPPATATTVRVRDGRREVQDGPFADMKEQLGGFLVIEVPDLDAALDAAARAPAALTGAVEVRPTMPRPAA